MILVAIACGLAGGFGAVAFRALIKLFIRFFWGDSEQVLSLAMSLPWYWRFVAPIVGGAIVGPMVYFFAKEAKGHGVPEVMEAVMLKGGTIRPRVVAVKSLASAVCIASGGSVGREGPIVQIGSALGSTIGQFFKVPERQLRTIVGCGAAAGIAATFNAPIAGALFAVEIILGDFRVPQFSPIVISSVVATVISRHFLGDFPAFIVPKYELVSPWELPLYLGVGVIAGIVSVSFINVLYWSEDLFDSLKVPEYSKAALGGILIGLLGIWLPHVFGVGYETINAALTGKLGISLLLFLLVAKLLATSITIGSGGSGGVFAPSLFLGAMTGGFLGHLIHFALPSITATPGAYALVTMGAVVAGATNAPITAIIMIFELTNDYTIIAPLMAACVVSTLVTSLLMQDSIYTLKLRRRGIDVFGHKDLNLLRSKRVEDLLDVSPVVVSTDSGLSNVIDAVFDSQGRTVFVTDRDARLYGCLSFPKLKGAILSHYVDIDVTKLCEPLDTVLIPNDRLEIAAKAFSRGRLRELPVVDNFKDMHLLGSVKEWDIMKLLDREAITRDLTGCMASSAIFLDRLKSVDLGNGYVLSQAFPPDDFLGHTLKELDVRNRYGIEVVMIRHSEDTLIVPESDYRIEKGDILLVAGTKKQVDMFKEF